MQGATLDLSGQPNPPFGPFALADFGTLTVNGGAINASGNADIDLATLAGATLTIQGGAHVSFQGTTIGNPTGQVGHLLVTGAGTLLNNVASVSPAGFGGFLSVGNNGSGDVTIANGASVTNSATVTLGGGSGGQGSLAVTNASLTAQSIEVGSAAGSTGTITLDNATVAASQFVNIGLSGAGTGTMTGGTWTTTNLNVARNTGSTGNFTLNGGSVTINGLPSAGPGFLLFGLQAGASGTMTIEGGGQVKITDAPQATYGIVQIGGSGSGALTVTGAGSLLDTGGNPLQVAVGNTAAVTGSLVVSQGARVITGTTNSSSIVATSVGRDGTGSLLVTDPGSTYTANGGMYVGKLGGGTLTVQNGATLTAGDTTSGIGIGTGGTISLNGTTVYVYGGSGQTTVDNATLTSVLGMSVGTGGDTGTLTVSNAGTVDLATQLTIGNTTTFSGTTVFSSPAQLESGIGTTVPANSTFDGTGTVTVTSGSALRAGSLVVGDAASGVLDVFTGSTVDVSGTVDLGLAAGGIGNADVEGASTLTAGGDIDIAVAGTATLTIGGGAVVQSTGGGVNIGAGGVIDNSGGTIDPPGTITNDGTINGEGTYQGGFVNDGTVNARGGVHTSILDITGGVTGNGQFTIATGGILEFDSSVAATDQVAFDDATGALDIGTLAGFHAPITGFEHGDSIHVTGVNGGSLSGTTLTLTESGAFAGTLTLSGVGGAAIPPALVNVSSGGVVTVQCFLAGTHILTEHGEVPVEGLDEGDRVAVLTASGRSFAPVRWIGRRRIDATRHRQPDQVLPIRIRRDAFAPAAPHRDLLLSPDHAVFVDGVLVLARLLVNGRTIVQDTSLRHLDYYHVELDRHAVLLSENLPTESYLDTGNRAVFENAGLSLILHPDFSVARRAQSWGEHACAPLVVAPAAVEPVWRRLAARADALGFPPLPPVETVAEPDLSLIVDGRPLRPIEDGEGRYVFPLPTRALAATLRSRATAPAEIDPFNEDRRRLGVPVTAMRVLGGGAIRNIAMDDPALKTGWWAAERDGCRSWRWTDGDAAIPLLEGAAVLEFQLRETRHRYLANGKPAAGKAPALDRAA